MWREGSRDARPRRTQPTKMIDNSARTCARTGIETASALGIGFICSRRVGCETALPERPLETTSRPSLAYQPPQRTADVYIHNANQ